MIYPTTKLTVDPLVVRLFRKLLHVPAGVQLFSNRFDTIAAGLMASVEMGMKVTAINPSHSPYPRDRSLFVMNHPNIEYFHPTDKFHLALSAFPFTIDWNLPEKQMVQSLSIRDRLQFFKCSEGKEDREAVYHLLGLEQLMNATLRGGYFAAVLPQRWVGREMKYLRWWNDNAAQVARIKLPESSVIAHTQTTYPNSIGYASKDIKLAAPGRWELLIWSRPLGDDTRHKCLKYANFRYSPFIFPLETLNEDTIDECVSSFKRNEWYASHVQNWLISLKQLHTDDKWGTFRDAAWPLDDPKNIYFFNPSKEYAAGFRIEETAEDIRKIKHAVHVKPGRKIRLKCYDATADGALLDLRANRGLTLDNKSGEYVFNYDRELKISTFSDIREKLVSDLERQGLIPCMTKNEAHMLKKRERWLAIQLTPIERTVPATKAAASKEGDQSDKSEDWETLYEDIGMEASFPEVMDLWRKRAQQMGLDKAGITFEFQFKDIIYYAAKQCLGNGNVMGLGKTRETLFGILLRGVTKALIVCPAKLIGVWQDEIDDTIGPYCRLQRRNWQGKVLDSSYQVIQHGRDLLPENLRMFNIISYDKLKTIAKDGRFFKCPKCGTIAYSHRAVEMLTCPGDSSKPEDDLSRCNNIVKRWKRFCAGDPDNGIPPKRKIRVALDRYGTPMKREDGTWHMVHFSKTHDGMHFDRDGNYFPVENTTVIDERPPRPEVIRMLPQESIFKKMRRKAVGYKTDPDTGRKVTEYKNVERNPHLRWTFAKRLRNMFNNVVLDEALYIMNTDSQRSQAINVLTAETRIILTGTPVKNKPENILALMNWCFSRETFPSYRPHDEGSRKRFLDKYQTVVYVGGFETSDGTVAGGVAKPIPKIANPEMFQAETAPFWRRHTRNEPEIIKDIPRKKLVETNEQITMDDEHREYYEKWLKMFAEWWQKMKEEEEGKNVNAGDLLAKLTYLINASTIPHNMLDNILKEKKKKDLTLLEWAQKIGPYTGKRPTAKMRRSWELLVEAFNQSDKTLIFSWRRANLILGNKWCERKGLRSMVVDGTVSLAQSGEGRSKRHQMIEDFRHRDYAVCWAGLEALAEGMNIPEANHGILLDCGWAPSQPRQAIGRMIRPAQCKTIYAKYLMHHGTIDDYMFALSYLKGRSADEAIDYMEFDDFSVDMIPDIQQYADAIVDGTEEKLKRKMWLAVDHVKRLVEEEGEEG